MSVKVVFEFTHTENGIEVKPEIVDGGRGGCICEVAFATTTVAEVVKAVVELRGESGADFAGGCYGGKG
ncbi:hypothetical protein AB2Z78_003422 [Salmonella enterica]